MSPIQLLILVTGAPGTGKSTLAPLLAQRYRCTLIAKDAIKEALFDTLGSADAAWSRKLSDASFAAMFALAAHGIETGASLLLEGNFRQVEHERVLRALLERGPSSLKCVQILCSVPEIRRRERLLARAKAGVRHPGHDDAAQMPAMACDFLDVPAARFGYQASAGPAESSKAEEGLFAAVDAHIEQA